MKMYLIIDRIFWVIIILSLIIVNENCRYIHSENIAFFISIGNISKALVILINPIIRFIYDPSLNTWIFRLKYNNTRMDHKYLTDNYILSSSLNLG